MNLFKISLSIQKFKRAIQIISVLLKFGIRTWVSQSWFGRTFISKKKKQALQLVTVQARIRLAIEELGPTFIKFGQILADRPDLISEPLRKELKKLQSSAEPLDDDRAINLIEHELGHNISDIFLEFNRKHIASASIGQAYKGKLKNGEEVIVKIQRPRIEQKIKLDLFILKFLAERVAKSYPELAAIDVVGVVGEFGNTIIKELNYLNEAGNQIRFYEIFKNDPRVKIPKVYSEFTTRKILVMEFIDGIEPDRIEDLEKAGCDPKIVAEWGADLILKMIMVHGFFHGDPHPGNIFVLKNNVICFIDFGMVGILKPRHMNFLAGFTLGFARKDAKTITQSILNLCNKKFYEYSEELEFEIEDMLRKYSYMPFEKIDFSQILQEIVNIIVKYKLQIPSSIFLLAKALATIQKFAERLHPEMSLGPVVMPYAKDLLKSRYGPTQIASGIYNTISDYVNLIRDLPNEINEILSKVKDGKMVHDIRILGSNSVLALVSKIAKKLQIGLILTALIIGSLLYSIYGDDKAMGEIIFVSSCIISGWVLLRLIFSSDYQPKDYD